MVRLGRGLGAHGRRAAREEDGRAERHVRRAASRREGAARDGRVRQHGRAALLRPRPAADLAVSRAVQPRRRRSVLLPPRRARRRPRVRRRRSLARWLPMDAFVDRPGATLGVSVGRGGHASSVTPRAQLASLPEFAAQMMAIMLASATGSLDDYAIDAQHADLVSLNVTAVDPIDFELCDDATAFMVGVGYNDVADQLVRCGHADEAQLRRPRVAPLAPCAVARARAAPAGSRTCATQLAQVRARPASGLLDQPPQASRRPARRPARRRAALPPATARGRRHDPLSALALGAAIARLLRPRAARAARGRGGADLKLPFDVATLSDEQCASLSMRLTSELCRCRQRAPPGREPFGGLHSLWLRALSRRSGGQPAVQDGRTSRTPSVTACHLTTAASAVVASRRQKTHAARSRRPRCSTPARARSEIVQVVVPSRRRDGLDPPKGGTGRGARRSQRSQRTLYPRPRRRARSFAFAMSAPPSSRRGRRGDPADIARWNSASIFASSSSPPSSFADASSSSSGRRAATADVSSSSSSSSSSPPGDHAVRADDCAHRLDGLVASLVRLLELHLQVEHHVVLRLVLLPRRRAPTW